MAADISALFGRLRSAADRKRDALERMIEIGALVNEYITRAGPAGMSLRELARHIDVGITPSMLSRALGVFHLCQRAPRWRRAGLSLSHLEAVLPLSDSEQDELLSAAEAKNLTVRELRRAIVEATHPTTERHSVSTSLGPVRRPLEERLRYARDAQSETADNDPTTKERLREILEETRASCDELERILGGERTVRWSGTAARSPRKTPLDVETRGASSETEWG